jgi:hypothetical protein
MLWTLWTRHLLICMTFLAVFTHPLNVVERCMIAFFPYVLALVSLLVQLNAMTTYEEA